MAERGTATNTEGLVIPGSAGKEGRKKKQLGVKTDTCSSASFVPSTAGADVEAPTEAIRAAWTAEQERLRSAVLERDDHADWPTLNELRLVGGTDISFAPGSSVDACATIVVLKWPSLEVVYESYEMVRLTAPYISGFLAFREAPHIARLLDKVRENAPHLVPQVLVVDGNGVHHPRACGLACHLGVVAGIPTFGVAKKLLEVEGINRATAESIFATQCGSPGSYAILRGDSGRTLGAVVHAPTSTHPLYVSVGHRIGLQNAIDMTLRMCVHRVPEPTRQADLRSREFLRSNYRPGAALPAATAESPSTSASAAAPVAVFSVNPKNDTAERRKELLLASDSGNESAVERLLSLGVDPNKYVQHPKYNRKAVPLHYAARSGHLRVVEMLLDRASAQADMPDVEDWTALYYAASSGHTRIVEVLLAHGAKADIRDNFAHRSPLDVAMHRQFHDIVKLLGGDPDDVSYHRTEEEAASSSSDKGVMRGVHFKNEDLFMGRYNVDEEDVELIKAYRRGWRSNRTLQVVAIDTVLDGARVTLNFFHDRDDFNSAVDCAKKSSAAPAGPGVVLRASAISTYDFMLVVTR